MRLIVEYEKPHKYWFDVFVNGKRLNTKKDICIDDDTQLTFVEVNVLLAKLWWLYSFFNLLFAFFGAFEDFRDVRTKQRKIVIQLGKITYDTLRVYITKTGDIQPQGVCDYRVISNEEVYNPQIARRAKVSRFLIIFIPILILFVIAVTLILTLCLKST